MKEIQENLIYFSLKDSRTMRPPEVQKEIDMLAKQSANTQSTEKG